MTDVGAREAERREATPAPVLVISGPRGPHTPFNLVPGVAVFGADVLLRLAAVPFFMLRDEPPYGENRIDLWFDDGTTPYLGAPFAGRPVVYWAQAEHDAARIGQIIDARAFCVLVLSSDETHMAWLANEHRAASAGQIGFEYVELYDPAAPLLIWTAFVEQFATRFAELGGDEVATAIRSRYGFAMDPARRRVVPADMTCAPSAILAALGLRSVPVLGDEITPQPDRARLAIDTAREVMGIRWYGAMRAGQRERDVSDERVEAHIADRLGAEAASLFAAHRADTDDDLPFGPLAFLQPPELIILCPSASVDVLDRARAFQFGPNAGPAVERERPYFEAVLRGIGQSGQRVEVPAPANVDQEGILDLLTRIVQGEGRFQAALATVYAARFKAAVLKLHRVGVDHAGHFGRLDQAVTEGESERLVELTRDLSEEITARIDDEYIDFIGAGARVGTPRIHAFSDYPLEFAAVGDDYLGFNAELARTPLTPGSVALTNYTDTESPIDLPTDFKSFVLVSALTGERPMFQWLDSMGIVGQFIRDPAVMRRADLIAYLESELTECLVYFGHGYHDPDLDESALVLEDGFLYDHEIADLARVPPVVIMAACNSAAATSVGGGLGRSFLRAGAQAVVASTFAVPESVAMLFTRELVSNLTLPIAETAAGDRLHENLTQIVDVARQRTRPLCAFLDLAQRGVWNDETMMTAARFWQTRWKERGYGINTVEPGMLDILAETLHEFGVIPHRETPPIEWPVVPYPLFFSVLGYPWHMRVNWGAGDD